MTLSQRDDRISLEMARHISAIGGSMHQPLPTNDMFGQVTHEQPMTIGDALKSGYLSFETPKPSTNQ